MSLAQLEKEFAPRSIWSIAHMARRMKLRKRRDWEEIARQHVPVIWGSGMKAFRAKNFKRFQHYKDHISCSPTNSDSLN
jgi:hypothetical protein